MAITKSDKQELDQLYSDWSDQYGGCKEDYFACLYLAKKHRCSVPDIAHQVAFGGNDYGLDGYYIDREARNLYLYQFKWSENHNLFKDSVVLLCEIILGPPAVAGRGATAAAGTFPSGGASGRSVTPRYAAAPQLTRAAISAALGRGFAATAP